MKGRMGVGMVEDEENGKLEAKFVTAIPRGKVSSLKPNNARSAYCFFFSLVIIRSDFLLIDKLNLV